MSRSHHHATILAVIGILVGLTISSCSGAALSTPTPSESNVGNFQTCEGFVCLDSIGEMTDVGGLAERIEVINVGSIRSLSAAGAIDNCLIEVSRPLPADGSPDPGASLSVSLVKFETSELAARHYNSTVASAVVSAGNVGDVMEIQQRIFGPDSFLVDTQAIGI